MTYLFSPYLWLLLVGVPVLIHLINRLRHRRIKWAAMEFLLQSQKRHRKWVILKQLLLLLLRMAAVAAIVLMVTKPQVRSDWAELFGGSTVHHLVLLDDSYSMSDRQASATAFDQAKQAVAQLARLASEQPGDQVFSLVRFSGQSIPALGTDAPIDAELLTELTTVLDGLRPSESAAGAAGALAAMRQIPTKAEPENRIIYLVSDFRAREWDNPTELRKLLAEIAETGAKIHLIDCVENTHPNVGISELRPQIGARAAGVELFMDVAVKNFGDEAVTGVTLKLEEDRTARPGLRIDEIPAGETVVRQFRVNFLAAGQHSIKASLDHADALEVDNTRYAAIDVADAIAVLVIDGDPAAHDGKRLADALSPGGNVQTGMRPRVERPQFLRKPEELAKFDTVFLANVGHLDPTEIETLENFVRAGGGVAFFVGELVPGKYYTDELYRAGQGLFPVPITRSTDLLAARVGTETPDVLVVEHPIFTPFLRMRNSPLDDVRIQRYFAVPADWRPDPNSATRVIARLRNDAPLIVERKFGAGRVVAVLTKASGHKTKDFGVWSNWPRNHSYLPTVVLLQSYLEAGRQTDDPRLVGQPIELSFDGQTYQRKVEFVTPDSDAQGPLVIDAERVAANNSAAPDAKTADSKIADFELADATPAKTKPTDSTKTVVPTAASDPLTVTMRETGRSGFYAATLKKLDGTNDERLFAYNVLPEEGDLHHVDGQQLAVRLEGLAYKYYQAAELTTTPENLAGINLGDKLLYLLIAILVGEQFLAYSASFHAQGSRVPASSAARKEVAR